VASYSKMMSIGRVFDHLSSECAVQPQNPMAPIKACASLSLGSRLSTVLGANDSRGECHCGSAILTEMVMRRRSRSTPIILTASWSPTDGLASGGPSSLMGQKPRILESSPTRTSNVVLRTKPTKAPYGLISSTTPRTVLPTGTTLMRPSSQRKPDGPPSP